MDPFFIKIQVATLYIKKRKLAWFPEYYFDFNNSSYSLFLQLYQLFFFQFGTLDLSSLGYLLFAA